MNALSNRLPVLAAEIRTAHAGVQDAAKTAAERAIEAGTALLEAKALLKHGEWLPWLQEHCALPERSAQFYMKIAKLGFDSATVADIGLRAAAKVLCVIHDRHYNPFHHCDEAGKRDWLLFVLFLIRWCKWKPDGAWPHCEWVLQKQFKTPDEWLGEEGTNWRRQIGYRRPAMSDPFMRSWRKFQKRHGKSSLSEIQAALVDADPA